MVQVSLFFLLSFIRDQLNNGPEPELSHSASIQKKIHTWSHRGSDGPQSWHHRYSNCGGRWQSPININQSETEYDTDLRPFIFHNFNQPSMFSDELVFNLTNNGHSASTKVNGDLFIEGGGLVGRYNTAEFHFHWGSSEDQGSEHTIDGHRFPLEMHIVHYAAKYGSISKAITEPDGLAVLGIYFQLSQYDNPSFEPVVEALQKVTRHGQSHAVANFILDSVIPKDRRRYFRYKGSLTTPPCYESVTWTIFAEPEKISLRQLRFLRYLIQHDHDEGTDHHVVNDSVHNNQVNYMYDNFRPVQPLNGRRVFCSYAHDSSSDSHDAPDTKPSSSSAAAASSATDHAAVRVTGSNPRTTAGSQILEQNRFEASSVQTGSHSLTDNKGNNPNLRSGIDNSAHTMSQITQQAKDSLLSGANFAPRRSFNRQNTADAKAQSRRQIHSVSEQFTDIKLQTAEIINDPKTNGEEGQDQSNVDSLGEITQKKETVSPASTTETTVETTQARITRAKLLGTLNTRTYPETTQSTVTFHPVTQQQEHDLLRNSQNHPAQTQTQTSTVRGGHQQATHAQRQPQLHQRAGSHAQNAKPTHGHPHVNTFSHQRPVQNRPQVRRPPYRQIQGTRITPTTPLPRTTVFQYPVSRRNRNNWRFVSRSTTAQPVRNALPLRPVYYRPNLRYNRPTQLLNGQPPSVNRAPARRQNYQRQQARQAAWQQQQQRLRQMNQRRYRQPVTAPTTAKPLVYLQPLQQPIRLAKPDYYRYFNNNNDNAYGPLGFGVDVPNFGEFRRRRKRSLRTVMLTRKRTNYRKSSKLN